MRRNQNNNRVEYSVIIPAYKDWQRLEKCISALLNSRANDDILFEIIVVDNDSVHTPPQFLKNTDKRVQVVHEPAPGSYAARNKGASVANGEIFAFTDSDCIPDENWLRNAAVHFEEKECHLIGGRIDIFREKSGSEWAYIYEKFTAFQQSKNVPIGRAVTANLIVKKEVFNHLKGFNSSVKSGGDWDFSQRAVDSGSVLSYAENVVVNHPARKSVGDILKKQKRFSAWGYLKVKEKHKYSGVRILAGNMYYGLNQIVKNTRKAEGTKNQMIIFLISISVYFYRSYVQMLIVLGLIEPDEVR